MLSKLVLQRVIEKIARAQNAFSKKVNTACEIYTLAHRGFTYDFHLNGELSLIKKIGAYYGENQITAFDVGANVGEYTQHLTEHFNHYSIHTFEVILETFDTLVQSVKAPNITHNNFGLSFERASSQIRFYGKNQTFNSLILNNSFRANKKFELKEIQLETGDNYCDENNIDIIDFMKIDVEGAEMFVLKGFEKMLQKQKIKIIQFEYGYANGDAHTLMSDFFKYLESFGYTIAPVRNHCIVFSGFNVEYNDFKSGPNFVAISQSNSELAKYLSQP